MFFLKFLKWRGSGVLAIEEFWKFSLKMGGSSMNGEEWVDKFVFWR